MYNFFVLDSESESAYRIMVDAGDGKVLYKSDAIDFKAMHGFGPGKFGHFGGHFGKMMPHQDWSETPEIPQESQ